MNIQSLINQVKVINEKYESIKKINGENFNIFSILKLETDEVQTHSNFIYELLNPNGSHNQGDIFLRLFLKQILKKKEYKNIGTNFSVQRETRIFNKKRIDFTIETSKVFIAIEMKINAPDGEEQLFNYHKYIQDKKEINKLYYLTLDGKEASEKSLKNLKVDEDYFLLSFEYDIYNWIEACIEKTATIPTIREGLVHYRNLVRKLTNQMGNEMDKEIIAIIKTPKDIKSMYTIHNKYANVLANKEAEFWESLYDRIEEKQNEFEVHYMLVDSNIVKDKIDYKYIAKKRKERNHNSFGLSISKTINSFQIECKVFFKDKKNLTMDIEFDKDENKFKLTNIQNLLEKLGFVDKSDDNLNMYFELKQQIKFYGNSEPTFELFDDKKFKKLVENTANDVIETLNKILEHEKELLKDF